MHICLNPDPQFILHLKGSSPGQTRRPLNAFGENQDESKQRNSYPTTGSHLGWLLNASMAPRWRPYARPWSVKLPQLERCVMGQGQI